MGDLKPLGSEKLTGNDKLKRILELTYYHENTKTNKVTSKVDFVMESTDGTVYGIVKEKDGYYVKKGLNENTLDYIGGMFMKNKNKFTSYVEAFKRLNLLNGKTDLQEATKYVLKTPNTTPPAPQPQAEAPVPTPTTDVPPAPAPDPSAMGDESMPPVPDEAGMGDEGVPPTGDENQEDDYLKIIQKLSGRLGQKLREYQDKLESDDIKYVLNMVISAVNLDDLDASDKDEIVSKFEDEDEYGDDTETPLETPDDEQTPPEEEDTDLGETMDKLEKIVNTPWEDEEELDEYMDYDSADGEASTPEVTDEYPTEDADMDKYFERNQDLEMNNSTNWEDPEYYSRKKDTYPESGNENGIELDELDIDPADNQDFTQLDVVGNENETNEYDSIDKLLSDIYSQDSGNEDPDYSDSVHDDIKTGNEAKDIDDSNELDIEEITGAIRNTLSKYFK